MSALRIAALPLVVTVGNAAWLGWLVMLILGALHTDPQLAWVPALGWWSTCLAVLLVLLVASGGLQVKVNE